MRLLPLPTLFLFLLAVSAWADGLPVRDGPAAAELVCEHESLQPGRSVTLGVVLHLDEGWHAYWVNPGDAGQPPAVAWTLPDGYEVGSLAWPAPHRLVEGPITSFVYEDELVLPVTLQVPEDAPEGETTIAAEVSWLACKDQCLPGKAKVSITRPVRAGATKVDRAAHERIARARDLLPVAVEANVEHEADRLILTVVGVEGTPTDFFPEEEGVFDLAALGDVWTSVEAGVFTTTLQLAEAGRAPERLVGVVVTAEPRKAFAVATPVERGASVAATEAKGGGPSTVVILAGTVIGLFLLLIIAMAVLRSGRRNQT